MARATVIREPEPLTQFSLRVYGTPMPQGSKKAGRNRATGAAMVLEAGNAATVAAFHGWRNDVKAAGMKLRAQAGWPPPMDGPIEVGLRFYLRRPSRHPQRERFAYTDYDIDKLTRAVLDGLGPPAGRDGQGGGASVFINDSRVVRFSMLEKLWCRPEERAGVLITARLIEHSEAEEAA